MCFDPKTDWQMPRCSRRTLPCLLVHACVSAETVFKCAHNFRCRFQNDQGVNYDVMLNQTVSARVCPLLLPLALPLSACTLICPQDIANNNNKRVLRVMAVQTLKLTTCRYYLIQLLQDDANSELFHVFKRWGRVGYSGGASRQSLEQYDSQAQGVVLRVSRSIIYCLMSQRSHRSVLPILRCQNTQRLGRDLQRRSVCQVRQRIACVSLLSLAHMLFW